MKTCVWTSAKYKDTEVVLKGNITWEWNVFIFGRVSNSYFICIHNYLLSQYGFSISSHNFSLTLQFDAEFRRWSINKQESQSFDDFCNLIKRLHKLEDLQFLISYIDPSDNDLLPINNDDNFHRALTTARPLLRVIIQRKGNLCGKLVEHSN